jgi:cobalt-zinc-cadmium efflux system protein
MSATPASQNRRRLTLALVITLTLMIGEIVGGVLSGSLALLADAGHMLTDAGALGLSLMVIWLSAKPATARKTFGYRRTEILVALANGLMLWVTVGIIAQEAYHRLKNPPDIMAAPMFIVACAGLAANLVTAMILKDGTHSHGRAQDLNMRGAYLHVIMDTWGSVGVIIAAIVVSKTGYTLADPLVSLLICGLILFSSWGLIRDSVLVLLEATPPHLDIDTIKASLRGIDGVTGVHDLHVWTVTSGFDALSCHVMVNDLAKSPAVLRQAHDVLIAEFGVEHSTIQIEVSRTDKDF